MNKTILQVPLDKQLKDNAERVASEQGFSSLQEIVRVFLARLASNKVEIVLQESITLSPESEKRYIKALDDFKSNKDVYEARSVEDFLNQLTK